MAQAKQDMGSGSVKKLMLQLMIPAVVAQVVNLLYRHQSAPQQARCLEDQHRPLQGRSLCRLPSKAG